MTEFRTKYGVVKIFAKTVDQAAMSQIYALANSPMGEGADIRIMPDVHSGSGCVIGTTMKVTNKITPSLVGVDIGCGMETAILGKINIDCNRLDEVINANVPAGFETRKKKHSYTKLIDLSELRCIKHVDIDKGYLSIGSLGGGNHFCELSQSDSGIVYFIVHSGSRNLGKQVCEWYTKIAFDKMRKKNNDKSDLIAKLKAEGREKEISAELEKAKSLEVKFDKDLTWLEGQDFEDYIHDMNIMQRFAELNRKAIVNTVAIAMGWRIENSFTTIHNYIDAEKMILRKGAIRANAGETVLIPMNMRDGSLLCVGKGNPDWNYSAPHGAGRLMSRRQAKDTITLEQFKETMEGIHSTSISRDTIDESPFAYKPMAEIMECIEDAVDIIDILRPLYNFKAGGD